MKTINEIKAVTMDTICNAKSGHPGMALSSAPILYTLYNRFIKANSKKSDLLKAMNNHIITKGELFGKYQRKHKS